MSRYMEYHTIINGALIDLAIIVSVDLVPIGYK